MSITRVAVAGATGRFSRSLISELLKKPDVHIHGIARNTSKVDPAIANNSRVKLFQSNADDASKLRAALSGTSVCVCGYLGDNNLMIDGQKTLIDACIAEGVTRYVASDYSFDFRGLKLGDHPAKDFHIHIAKYLDEKKDQIQAVHVIVGAFMEVIGAPFFGAFDDPSTTFHYWGSGGDKWDLTSYRDSAAFVAEVACDPKATGYLAVRGDLLSVKDLASTYHAVYGGKEPGLNHHGSLTELHKKMTEAFAQQPENVFGWMGMYYIYWMSEGATAMRKVDNERYPSLKTESVKEFWGRRKKEEVPKLMEF